jgi:hypothetical protein
MLSIEAFLKTILHRFVFVHKLKIYQSSLVGPNLKNISMNMNRFTLILIYELFLLFFRVVNQVYSNSSCSKDRCVCLNRSYIRDRLTDTII